MNRPLDKPPGEPDAEQRTARREALVVAGIWLAAMIWTVGYCTRFGYGRSFETLTFIAGIPDWVFWGILVPWGVCTALACWLSFGFIEDHDLDADQDSLSAPGGSEEASDG